MIELVTANQNMPFAVALAVMLGIAILEGVASLLGTGISSFLDSLLPDTDFDIDVHADINVEGAEIPSIAPFTHFLGWLRIGQVPILVLLVLFLTSFGLIGLVMQSIIESTLGFLLPGIIASVIAFILSLPAVHILGGGLKVIMPKDETDAVAEESLTGRVAVITLGTAKKGKAAEAKVKDQHGLTHYVMVEPDEEDATFTAHQAVLLVKKEGPVFKAIENRHSSLVGE